MPAPTNDDGEEERKWAELSWVLLSFLCALPSLGLSAWLALDRLGVQTPYPLLMWLLWYGLFLAALPTAPVSFLCGCLVVWRRPLTLLWLVPASAYWVAFLLEDIR